MGVALRLINLRICRLLRRLSGAMGWEAKLNDVDSRFCYGTRSVPATFSFCLDRGAFRPWKLTLPMKFRKLRIAWSVVWGLMAVLLAVLWVRDHVMPAGTVREEPFFFHIQSKLAILCSAFALAPLFRWRFSLRSLLIAITVIAVVLGLVAYNLQKLRPQ